MLAACSLIRKFLSNMYVLCVRDNVYMVLLPTWTWLSTLESRCLMLRIWVPLDLCFLCDGQSESYSHPFVSVWALSVPTFNLAAAVGRCCQSPDNPCPPHPSPLTPWVRAAPGGASSLCGGSDRPHCRRSIRAASLRWWRVFLVYPCLCGHFEAIFKGKRFRI